MYRNTVFLSARKTKACLAKVGTLFGKKDTLKQRAKALARIRMIAPRFGSADQDER